MSVHKRTHKTGTVWRVQWRDEQRRQRSRTFSLKRDAAAWDSKIKLAKRQGELSALDRGKQSLKEFHTEWRRLHAEPHLAPRTLKLYDDLANRRLIPKLGHVPLRQLTPERIQESAAELADESVPAETIRKALILLQGILERAVEWGRIPNNPARYVRKPRSTASRLIEPLSPRQVEDLRRAMLAKKRLRDATLISVLAYAGLRPGEALALRWGDVRERTIRVDKAISLGEERSTKTRRNRTVKLLKPLATDLAKWRLASGESADGDLIFPNRDGNPWSEVDYRNWRKRRFKILATELGLASASPYVLRHSFASLLLAEQDNPAEVAAQLGHSLQVLFSTYAHVIEDLRGSSRVVAEDVIREARRPRRRGRSAEARKIGSQSG